MAKNAGEFIKTATLKYPEGTLTGEGLLDFALSARQLAASQLALQPERLPDKMSHRMSDNMMTGFMSDRMPDRMSEYMSMKCHNICQIDVT